MKRTLLVLLLAVSQAFAGNVTGVIQTAGGNPIANATLGFTPTMAAVEVGQFVQTASTVNCYTDAFGNVVGIPNPLSLPVAVAGNAGSLTASTIYYIELTFYNSVNSTESAPSPELAFTLSPGNSSISITGIALDLQPASATGYKVYASTTSGAEKLQKTVVGFGGTGFGSILSVTSPPSTNNSICTFNFSDSLIPQATYSLSIIDSNSSPVPGFPEVFYMQGSTFNLNSAFPTANTDAIFPQAIVSQPSGNALQSIHGPLTLNGFSLTAGPITANGTINTTTGYQLNGAAPSGHVLVGNGTNYVDTVSSGFTGSGSTNTLTKFTGSTDVGNSSFTDDGTNAATTEPFSVPALSSKSENGLAIIHVDRYASWAAAFADCPTAGCTLDGRSVNTPTTLGTIDPGTVKALTILLGPLTFTLDHFVVRSGLVVKGMGIENVQGTKIQAVGTSNQAPFILPTSGTLQSIQGVTLSDFELEATVGNTAQDGLFFDVSVGNLPAGSNLEYSKFSRIFPNGFKGSAVHLKGPIISATSVVQFNDFEIIQPNPPASSTTIGTALRMEGAVGQNMFFNFTASQQGGSPTETLIYAGVTNDSDGVGPYSNQFYGTTIQNGAVGVLINGCQSCVFRDSHAELDSIVFQVKTPSGGTWHNDVLLLDGGVANGNVGINSGAGAIVDASNATNTYSTTVILENWTFAPPANPDKIAKGVNGSNVVLFNNKFDLTTPAPTTTGVVSGYSTSTTTLNFQNARYAFVNGCSGGNVQTLTSALTAGEALNLYFNVSCAIAGGGNILLGAGSPSPITFNSGEQATFINTDQSGTNQWVLLSTTAAKTIGFFSSPGRTTALTATTVYGTPPIDTGYTVIWSVTCKTTVAAATATATITYTDTSGTAQSVAGSTATCTALGTNSHATNQIALDGKASTNIQVAVAIAGSPNYDVRVGVIKLGGN